jgi:hypothetical protein
MNRRVEPELLDELAASDPRAIRSRRDLRRVNAWMRNARIMAGALRSVFRSRPPHRLVELGAGDGTFLLRVAQELSPDFRGTTAVLLDRRDAVSPITRGAYEALGWQTEIITADVFDWLGETAAQNPDAIIANLFLHHFSDEQLSDLLAQAARKTRVVVAIEPRRWVGSLAFGRLLWMIGCSQVTRHDALVSIRAGFAEKELSRLWTEDSGWSLRERPANLASHLFIAERAYESSSSSCSSS